jgi:hypothetical protein
MTSEELAAAGIPPEAKGTSAMATDSAAEASKATDTCEDAEIESGKGEDISNVDANVDELVAPEDFIPPTLVFGKSFVTPESIKEFDVVGFFPSGDGHAPGDEEIPAPKADEIIIFKDFFTAGLRFPCDNHLPSLLDRFSVKMHQLTPNSFIELSKFFWIMRTFDYVISADVFARLFELHIQRKAIKLDDGKLYEAYYGCCTFNTRRKSANQKIKCIQLAPCSNNKWPDDWLRQWFYVKVDMDEVLGRIGAFYPFYCPMGPMNAICTAMFNRKTPDFMIAENRFGFACRIL